MIYLPDEIYAALTDLEGEEQSSSPVFTMQSQESRIWFYRDGVLEQACTVLAALRSGEQVEDLPPRRGAVPTPVLVAWLRCLKCLDDQNNIQPEAIRRFLESQRPQALYILTQAWRGSMEFNELRMLRGLEFEGTWTNDPADTRERVIELVNTLAGDDWMDLSEFVSAAKQKDPDFQRSGGEYDSWFIRESRTGEYLKGFESWDRVEGALLRFYITGLLYWLGLVELTAPPRVSSASVCHPGGRRLMAIWRSSKPKITAPRCRSIAPVKFSLLPASTWPRAIRSPASPTG
jgi:hypothetical protein